MTLSKDCCVDLPLLCNLNMGNEKKLQLSVNNFFVFCSPLEVPETKIADELEEKDICSLKEEIVSRV